MRIKRNSPDALRRGFSQTRQTQLDQPPYSHLRRHEVRLVPIRGVDDGFDVLRAVKFTEVERTQRIDQLLLEDDPNRLAACKQNTTVSSIACTRVKRNLPPRPPSRTLPKSFSNRPHDIKTSCISAPLSLGTDPPRHRSSASSAAALASMVSRIPGICRRICDQNTTSYKLPISK